MLILPSWYLGRHPEANIILASYNSEFAERFCRKNKDKIKRCGKQLFGIEMFKENSSQSGEGGFLHGSNQFRSKM